MKIANFSFLALYLNFALKIAVSNLELWLIFDCAFS
jgi:hypothetical protein